MKSRKERRADAVEVLRTANFIQHSPLYYIMKSQGIDYGHTTTKRDAEILIDLLSEDECHNTVDEDWGTFECSECGTQWEVTPVYIGPDGTSEHDLVIPNYCPRCGARVKSKGASEIAHLSDAEQENRRSHEDGDGTSVSFDTPKVTLADGDCDFQSQSLVSLRPESETTDSRENIERCLRVFLKLPINEEPDPMESGVYYNIIGLLDRQASITAGKLADGWAHYKSGAEKEIGKLAQERDQLREKYSPMKGVLNFHKRRAEELQKEIDHQRNATADMVEQLWHAYDTTQMVNRSLWERWASCHRKLQNSIELPKDADGEPIRLGDKVMHKSFVNPVEVVGVGKDSFFYRNGISFNWFHHAHEVHHPHKPTVADILKEFGEKWRKSCDAHEGIPKPDEYCFPALLREYAGKLELKEDSHAHE